MKLSLLVFWGSAALSVFAAELPSPALLVLNKDEATLAIVNPADGKVVGRVPTGEGPHEIATDGKLAFVANYGAQTPGSTLSVIDLAAQKELRRVDLGALRRPHGIAVSDGKVYFTAEVNKLIGRYDPATNQIDFLLGTGQNTTHMVYVSKARNQIYTANITSDSITIIEPGRGGWNETVVPVGKGPEGFDVSPDGKELWAAHSVGGGVSVIDLSTKKVAATLEVPTQRSNRLKFTPDGKRVLISDLGGGTIVVVDTATRKETARIPMGTAPEGILITPDGSRAYVAVAGESRLAILDLATLKVTGHLETGKGPDGMAWVQR